MIPRFKPWIDYRELMALLRPNRGAVERFEREFARHFQAVDAVAFPYGRSALHAFLQAIGLHNAEIIMPAYTCSVVAHAISLSGNIPRFIDIRLFDYNMDLDLLPDAINEKTRAIVATHLFGYPLDLDRLESIVAEAESKYGHKIWVIQDCAHSFGAEWKGRMVGTSGDAALYALNISKMMTSIFGGMLTFSDKKLAAKVRLWRDRNFHAAPWYKPWLRRIYLLAVTAAFNETLYGLTWWLQEKTPLLDRLTKSYHLDEKIHFPPDAFERMLEVEAAVGLEQLKKYPKIIARRRAVAKWYDENLYRPKGWEFPPIVEGATYSHYVVRVPDRKKTVEAMAAKGVHLGELIQYSVPELKGYTFLSKVREGCCLARCSSTETINIPIHSQINRSLTARRLKWIKN